MSDQPVFKLHRPSSYLINFFGIMQTWVLCLVL
uniref:Uncharacterized protein n=1 Tax=Arundo donax TaxID=35708 RepID=A0A0A9C492_ARUDO